MVLNLLTLFHINHFFLYVDFLIVSEKQHRMYLKFRELVYFMFCINLNVSHYNIKFCIVSKILTENLIFLKYQINRI